MAFKVFDDVGAEVSDRVLAFDLVGIQIVGTQFTHNGGPLLGGFNHHKRDAGVFKQGFDQVGMALNNFFESEAGFSVGEVDKTKITRGHDQDRW